MSGRCTGWVLKHGPRDRAMRAVLIVIADAANSDGEHAHPGTVNLIEGSLYSRATVFSVLGRLEKEGWVTTTERGTRSHATTFTVHMDTSRRVQPLDSSPNDESNLDDDESNLDERRVQSSGSAPITSTVSNNGLTTSEVRPEVARLCDLLADLIASNGSKRPTVTKQWLDSCRLLIDKDARTPEQVEAAIRWSQQDDFWRGNIMSMTSLRKQYDRLRLAAKRERGTAGSGESQLSRLRRARERAEEAEHAAR